jgi:hypothetical protein
MYAQGVTSLLWQIGMATTTNAIISIQFGLKLCFGFLARSKKIMVMCDLWFVDQGFVQT